MFNFEWVWILLILPLPLLVYKFLKPAKRAGSCALKVPFYNDLVEVSKQTKSAKAKKSNAQVLLAWLVWILLTLASARPVWITTPTSIQTSGRDLMLAVDLSASMEQNDMYIKNQQVNRLVATKKVMKEFVERRKGDRLGLILFGTHAYLQAPLTYDLKTVETLLNESNIGMAGTNTAIGDAIGLAVKHLRKRPENLRVLILLTDGANTAGDVSPLQAAQIAAKEKIKIYSIGLGATEIQVPGIFGSSLGAQTINPSADLDEKTLSEMAKITNGKYFRARNLKELDKIYEVLDKLEPALQEEEIFRLIRPLFYFPLFLALFISFIMVFLDIGLFRVWFLGRLK